MGSAWNRDVRLSLVRLLAPPRPDEQHPGWGLVGRSGLRLTAPTAHRPAPSAAPRGRKARTGRAGRARNDGVGREGPARPRGLAPRPPRAAAPRWAMGEARGGGGRFVSPRPSVGGGGRYPPHAGGDVSTDAAPPPQPPAGSAVTRGAAAAAAPPPCRLGAESTGRGGGETGARRTAGTLRRGPTHRPYGGKAAARRPSSLCARESRRGPRAAPPPP